MFRSLSGRFLILTVIFVMLAEILIFLPSVARFRQEYLLDRLERAQIASLALLADDELDPDLEAELLENARVYNVVLHRDDMRQLVLASPIPETISASFDLREATAWSLIGQAVRRLLTPRDEVLRVIGVPSSDAGMLIEVTMSSAPLRMAMLDYGMRILLLSAVISVITAILLFFAVRRLLVTPIHDVVAAVQTYAAAPEDARRIIEPRSGITEVREAEEALRSMQVELTAALKQKERLAQLGQGVAKISHDLRNILTSAQLFGDRIETSEDPVVRRLAPKLMNSVSRAINLSEATLAFGRSEEPPPKLSRFLLEDVVHDVIESERLAAGDHDISFAEDVPSGLQVRGDPEQIYRVLSNLVRNARQAIVATGEPGEICIHAEEDAEYWRIEVRDTGPGLPPKARDHLFEPFQGYTSKGGSGLGLTISLELLRGHGGDLKLIETGEGGCTFEIRLPQAAALTV
ncbi:sensor histidine kinase [Poseidonocella sedimentorum]|uniref:histidine kinase n=1 Tax=Poseidonocella sedimentorum TaxID=871652 RepID=A0A1I6DMD2_9RHOB|nr:HAMP domain-containing sensor histidine kinase [Poseidonocella sedimentorum]SFR06584.1 Signal transduction histidine kinase [Poseidonocella sedimentorum]